MEQGNQATGLYTQEQIDYVSNIPDSELRNHLLHQISMCDNLRANRDAFEKQAAEWSSIAKAIEVLKKELGKDNEPGSYYHTWQSNIAVVFHDECEKWMNEKSKTRFVTPHAIPEIANNAAKNFLDLLCSKSDSENM